MLFPHNPLFPQGWSENMSYLQMALKAAKATTTGNERNELNEKGKSAEIRLAFEVDPCPGHSVIWQNPFPQGTPEARRQSLEGVMTAILLDARNRIIEACKGRQYHADEKTQQMELNIDRIWNEVISGSAKLEDFRTACGNWISSSAEAIHE